MKIAVVIYDNFSLLNLAQILNALSACQHKVRIYALKEAVQSAQKACVRADVSDDSLYGNDAVIICDGECEDLAYNSIFTAWLRSGAIARKIIGFGRSALLLNSAKFENFSHFRSFDEAKFLEFLTD
ncbi:MULTISPECIES: hypothetical protein [unclassified Campylobacter]|uniref:hypothetical protein n=1 Tax=unclassified Campylobacter TaxID=2593542 RepID=UPI0022EA0BA3|nr:MULTISPECIES: hypothetical protein [unclassified Campylobacter]MDA3054589.1 hypothetical protein [Campylobacter sp. VBCF_07 NA4]MDA3060627.1 hypothetical protein [Campylobacter sp. VBCF_02 NA5]MDA3070107.1 hypothetical protein [Campylobacter sp. VBCF_08 NA3]WBR54543.1 hypothetical protein PF027_01355 [Campylobacter sp. VBCF_01 NA2]